MRSRPTPAAFVREELSAADLGPWGGNSRARLSGQASRVQAGIFSLAQTFLIGSTNQNNSFVV